MKPVGARVVLSIGQNKVWGTTVQCRTRLVVTTFCVLSKTLNCLPSPEQDTDRKLFTESAGPTPRAKGVAPLLVAHGASELRIAE